MNFGPQLDLEASRTMTESFLKTGNNELDTAYVYNGGDTEKYLGEILPKLDGYYLATKVHPLLWGIVKIKENGKFGRSFCAGMG